MRPGRSLCLPHEGVQVQQYLGIGHLERLVTKAIETYCGYYPVRRYFACYLVGSNNLLVVW